MQANANSRLEAFCDGVFAIALTLLIIDIKPPETAGIHSTADLWRALGHLTPSILAFLMSFGVVLITWVNHHNALKAVIASSPSFIYANGLLLLTVVFIPFPTALLGAYLWTDHAAPAVVLYDAVLALQALAWLFVCGAALNNRLVDERAIASMRERRRSGIAACVLYGLFALFAFWMPIVVAVLTMATWIFWLAFGFRRHAA